MAYGTPSMKALVLFLLVSCAPYHAGDCRTDAAVCCLLVPGAKVAWWAGERHVQAFDGERWYRAGHDGTRIYAYEAGRDMAGEFDVLDCRDFVEAYGRVKK